MSQEHVEIVRSAIEAGMRGDPAGATDFWDDDIEWIPPPEDPDRAVVAGASAARMALWRWLATWEGYRYAHSELIDAAENVVQSGRQVATTRGAEVSSEIFFVWTFRRRRAIRMRMFYDRTQALEAAEEAYGSPRWP